LLIPVLKKKDFRLQNLCRPHARVLPFFTCWRHRPDFFYKDNVRLTKHSTQQLQLALSLPPSVSLPLSLTGRSLRVHGAEGCSLDDILMVRLFMRLWTPAAGVSSREKSHFTTSTTHKFYSHTRV